MPSMNDISHDYHYSLFKGEPGTWKSSTAVTYPGPQYWFSFDRKMNALSQAIKKFKIDSSQIDYDDYSDWTKARIKLESFISGLTAPKYKTYVIDSITTCADAMLSQVLKEKFGKTRASGATAGKTIGGISVNEMEDFNAEAAGLTELLSLTKELCHYRKVDIILIAHVIRVEQKDPSGKVSIARTLVTAGKKPAAKIPAVCDETYHFNVKPSPIVGQNAKIEIFTTNVGDDFARTTLSLDHTIELDGEKNFYQQVIKPAIEKMR